MSHFVLLRRLGLSKTAIRCYQILTEKGPAEVSDLAKELGLKPTNLYGTLEWLTEEGFIVKHKSTTLPTLFKARPLDKSLLQRYMRHRLLLMPLLDELGLNPPALPLYLLK